MKKFTAVFLAVLLVFGSVCCFSVSATSSHNSLANALSISLGKGYTASWYDSASPYVSKFSIGSRGYVTLNVSKAIAAGYYDYADMDLILYNSSGNIIWRADNSGQQDSVNSKYIYNVGLNKGTYYFNILPMSWSIPYRGTLSASYSVSFKSSSQYEIEPNNSTSTATLLSLGKTIYGVYGDESYDSSYKDYYKISLKKGHTYNFKIGNYGKLDATTTIFSILNPSAKVLTSWPDDNGNLKCTATTSGYYYLRLDNCGNKAGYSYNVTVKDITTYISATSLKVYVGYSSQLKIVNPKGKVTWSSSNSKVATVNSSGKVYGKKAGKVTISAKNNGKVFKCTVTVVKPVVTKVALSASKVSIAKGKTYTLKKTITPSVLQNTKITWKSSNSAVASVNSSGKITAKKKGTCTITASSSNNKKATCKVTVYLPVTGVKLSKSSMTVTRGKTGTLKATVSPSGASNYTTKWSSSNSAIATVSSKGVVTGKKIGTATITVTCGSKKATCKVTVKDPPVSSISMSKTLTMTKGTTYTLKATASPSGISNLKYTWKSSNTAVATVSSSGLVTAKALGTVKITATCQGKSATCTVTVKDPPVSAVSLPKTISLEIGETHTLNATITPSGISNLNITWKSSDTKVATVSSSGLVTAVAPGTANITATCQGKSATCAVTVNDPPISDISVLDSLTLTKGETHTLIATLTPSEISYKSITWKSSDTKVATVSASGVITAVAPGTADITATCQGMSATCAVTVNDPPISDISVLDSLTLTKGDKYNLTANVTPSSITYQTITWNSSDTNVATVSSSGLVMAISAGVAEITATCQGMSATCVVTVKNPPTKYEKLRDYILKNGSPGVTDDPAIIHTDSRFNLYSEVSYNASTEKFCFYYYDYASCENLGIMYMDLSGNTSMSLNFKIEIDYSSYIRGTVTIIPSEYTNESSYKPPMQYTYKDGNAGYLSPYALAENESRWVKNAYSTVSNIILVWNVMLLENGFSFKDFGFTSY